MKWYPIMVSICISLLSDQLIFDKNQVGKGWTFQKIVLKQLLIHKQTHTHMHMILRSHMQKLYLEIDHRPECKKYNYEAV